MSGGATLDGLSAMTPARLRACWRDVLKEAAPDVSPNLMRHAIAQRLQERQHGKLLPAHVRRINRLQKQLLDKGCIEPAGSLQLMPGTQLLRKWGGATHVVLVLDNEFEYRGKRCSSLTQIAESITGAHWSGPRFFGIVRRSKKLARNG
jgi:hypothetical protein